MDHKKAVEVLAMQLKDQVQFFEKVVLKERTK
jgi:hypothetical protein